VNGGTIPESTAPNPGWNGAGVTAWQTDRRITRTESYISARASLRGNRLIILSLLIADAAPVATQPMLETIEIQIDHRCGVERQKSIPTAIV
jgi:hypothetical protein